MHVSPTAAKDEASALNGGENENPFSKHGCDLSNPSLFDFRGLVGGRWRSGKDNKTFRVYEPSSGGLLRECADLGRDDILEAIDCAYDGYQKFSASTTAQMRSVMLRKWYDLILVNAGDCRLFAHNYRESTPY